jgi:hypothetical protein
MNDLFRTTSEYESEKPNCGKKQRLPLYFKGIQDHRFSRFVSHGTREAIQRGNHLTLLDIVRARLDSPLPEFAFLSVSHTEGTIIEEGPHLTSAVQYSGILERTVVQTKMEVIRHNILTIRCSQAMNQAVSITRVQKGHFDVLYIYFRAGSIMYESTLN